VSLAPIETARRLRRDLTDAERRIWYQVRGGRIGGAKFRRQQPMGRYVVDFVCHESKLIVELDGGQHAEREAADSARTRWLESQGYRVIRFWNNDVLKNTDGVIAEIMKYLSPSHVPSPPAPLPQGARGVSEHAPPRGSPSPLMGEGWGEGESECK